MALFSLPHRVRKRLVSIGWLCLAAFLALYGVIMLAALVGGVNLRPVVIPVLRVLARPLEIGLIALYPLVCWLGWLRRSLAPSWDLGDGTRAVLAPETGSDPSPGPAVSRWRRLLHLNIFGLVYSVVAIPAAIAMLTFYGVTSLQSDGLAAFLSRWNYPLAGIHIVASGICFIAWWGFSGRSGRTRPGRLL